MTAPTLETPRLILRAHRRGDFDDLCAMWSDPEVTRDILGRPSGEKESWDRLLRYAGLWGILGYGYWAVTDRTTGAYLGDVGLANFHRQLDPPLPDLPEAGWVFARHAQGQGFAREAVRAMLDWADESLEASATLAIFAPEHERSIRLGKDMGFGSPSAAVFAETDQVLALSRPKGG